MRILSSGREGNIYDTRKINDMLYVSEKYVNVVIKAKLGIVFTRTKIDQGHSRNTFEETVCSFVTALRQSIIGRNFYHDNYSN